MAAYASAATAAAVPLDEAADRRRRILAIVGASSGNLVEWYDFYVYAFTALYFAPAFFPSGDRTTQLLNAAGIFAAGFLVRPIGGWFFGRLGDRRGRRHALVVTVEDNGRTGGVGSVLSQALRDADVDVPTRDIGIPQRFLEHGARAQVQAEIGLTAQEVARRIVEHVARREPAMEPADQ